MVTDLSTNFMDVLDSDESPLDAFVQKMDIRLLGCNRLRTEKKNVFNFMTSSFLMVSYRKGSVLITHGGQSTLLSPGSVFIFRPFEIYNGVRQSPGAIEFYYVNFDITPFTERYNITQLIIDLGDDIFNDEKYRRSHSIIEEYLLENRKMKGRTILLKSQIKTLLTQLAFDCINQGDSFDFIVNNNDARVINRAFYYVAEHISEPINISAVVEYTYTSKTSLDRAFKNSLGISPHTAFMRFKIERSFSMLQQRLSATDIARELGFSSVYHFSNKFKQVTGMRPSEYRNKLK